MAKRLRDEKGRFIAKDALATFTKSMASSLMGGMYAGGYRDSPFSGYAKDATGVANTYYSTSWIARQAVEGIPEDCFKKGYQWVATAEQVSRLEAVEKRHKVQQKKRQALSWSRLDGEAYIYYDTGDDASQELRVDRVRRDGLRFVNVLRKRDVIKGNLVKDPISPYYGQPEYYEVTGGAQTVRIHPSRVVHFICSPSADTGDGQSVLLYMLAPIIAAETARDNVVALTTEALIDVLGAEGLMDAVSDPEMEALVVKRYALARQLKATNKMMVIDKDKESFDRKPASFATLPDVIEAMRREAAAAIGRPYALLFGRPAGLGTNGDVELKNYYDEISTMQRNDIQPQCEVLDEVIIRSALGSRPPEVYIEWSSLWETSDKEKADIASVYATAAKTAVDSGAVPPDVLTASLINAWVEIGAFQGIEQEYAEWLAGGGELDEVDEGSVSGRANSPDANEDGSVAT